MKKRISFILSLCTVLSAFAGVTPVMAETTTLQAEYWVSTTGNDNNAGTEDAPFKTVEKARDTIRGLTKTGNIVVNIEPGNYYFDETLEFTADDSGADGYTVTYKSSGEPGAVNFIGGRAVAETEWEEYKDGIYYTDIDPANPIYMIYEEGESNSYSARYPNLEYSEEFPTAKAPYLYAKGGTNPETGKKYTKIDSNKSGYAWYRTNFEIGEFDSNNDGVKDTVELDNILPENSDIRDLRMVVWPGGRWDWSMEFHKISCLHPTDGLIRLGSRMQYAVNRDNNGTHGGARYYLMGHLNLLDTAGEFCMDTTYFRLYYKPYNTANLTNGKIIIPTVDTVMSISAEATATAKNIVFEGITFKNTDFIDTVGYYIDNSTVSPAVSAKNVENVDFTSCVVKDVAGDGITMSGIVKNCDITNSHFKNIGRNGILITGNDVYGTDKTAANASAQLNTIKNCFLEYIGTTLGQGNGITLTNNYNSTISHCTLENGTRKGIVLKRSSSNASTAVDLGENLVEYILINGFGQDSGDTAGIHLHGIGTQSKKMTNNEFNQIWIKNMKAHESINDHQPSGFYADYGTDRQIVRNMLVEDYGYWPRILYGGNTTNEWPACQEHTYENVSWITADGVTWSSKTYTANEQALYDAKAYFDESKMEKEKIGVDEATFTFANELE